MVPLTVLESMLEPYFCDKRSLLSKTDGVVMNDFGYLEPSIFKCDRLPECTVACPGPNIEMLESTSKNCACMAEWYANGYLIQMFVSLVIYLILNVSR